MSSSLKKNKPKKQYKASMSDISESIKYDASNRFTSSIKESIKEEPESDISESIEEVYDKQKRRGKMEETIRHSFSKSDEIKEMIGDSYSDDFESVS
jgi:hypothetical protein